jgi:hypothetical protein
MIPAPAAAMAIPLSLETRHAFAPCDCRRGGDTPTRGRAIRMCCNSLERLAPVIRFPFTL